ncbi:MAG: hypothetical protein ACM3ZE_12685 [Myxococcales bacterium]
MTTKLKRSASGSSILTDRSVALAVLAHEALYVAAAGPIADAAIAQRAVGAVQIDSTAERASAVTTGRTRAAERANAVGMCAAGHTDVICAIGIGVVVTATCRNERSQSKQRAEK